MGAGPGRLWLVVGVLALALSGYRAWAAWRDLAHARGAVRDMAAVSRQAEERLRRFEKERRDAGQSIVGRVLLNDAAPPSRILAEVESVLPTDVRLASISVEYGPKVIVDLRVRARTAKDYDALLSRLGGSSAFTEVIPGVESREGEVDATVRATLRLGEARTP
jgi:Tfp pilus assembly protein PilN